MKPLIKIISILIVTILVIFSVYVSLSAEEQQPDNNSDAEDEGEDDDNENQDNNNDTEYGDFTHTVLIEEGTATWCKACPIAGEILYELLNSGNYNFYYIAMVDDVNNKAKNRLKDDYNIQAYPALFFDGGYRVVVGGVKSEIEQALIDAESRDSPQIRISLDSKFDNKTKKIKTQILIENNETENYSGSLKVYLTEIISQVNNFDNRPYHYAFVDYIERSNINVNAKGNKTIVADSYDIGALDPDNLMVIATIFNSQSVVKDSYEAEEGGEFDAYFADATNATKLVTGGNLPPSVGISLPETGKLHILGRPVLDITFQNTIVVGQTTIAANVEDDSGVEKVEFYINGELKNTDTNAPYEYSFRKVKLLKRFVRQYTISIIAYDTEGKTNTVELNVIGFFL